MKSLSCTREVAANQLLVPPAPWKKKIIGHDGSVVPEGIQDDGTSSSTSQFRRPSVREAQSADRSWGIADDW